MNEPKVYDVIANFRHYPVTQAQVDACTRLVDRETGEVIYLVRSEHLSARTGRAKVYIVRYYRELKRIGCTCDSGLEPTCPHRRAAAVSEREYQKARQNAYDAKRRGESQP